MALTAETIFLVGTDGVPFTISLFPLATVNLYQHLDLNGIATSDSPKDAIIDRDCYITDWVCSATPTGTYELVSNGKRTQIMLNRLSHLADNAGRPVLRIPLARGTQLRVRSAVACT